MNRRIFTFSSVLRRTQLRRLTYLALLSFSSIAPMSFAVENLSGYIGFERKQFFNDPIHNNQEKHTSSVSGFIEYHQDFSDSQLVFSGFGRHDHNDAERSNWDIRELYWWQDFNTFQIYAGIRKVFWGVTESVHLVDIINQTDQAENINGDEKLGQPMVQFLLEQDWGTIEAFILPYSRERTFPGEQGRLRTRLPIVDAPTYQSSDEENHIDLALRWSHYFSIWDFGLSHYSGTARIPAFIPYFEENSNSQPVGLSAYYAQIEQTGWDMQATIDAWLLKAEIVSLYEQDYGRGSLFAGGIEYSFFAIAGGNSDIGIIAEYQFDDRPSNRATIAQNDLALGVRWALNDIDGSELLFIVNKDLDHDNAFITLEANRRINDDWKLEIQAVAFEGIEEGTPEYDFREDDHLQVEIRRYF